MKFNRKRCRYTVHWKKVIWRDRELCYIYDNVLKFIFISLCKAMLFLSDHWITFWRSVWRRLVVSFCESDIAFEIRVLSLVSKASNYWCAMQFSISLKYMRNKICPKTVPCGTPLIIGAEKDGLPSTTTIWWRSLRKDSIYFTIFGWMLYNYNCFDRSLWSTLSKALAYSR